MDGLKRLLRRFLLYFLGVILFMAIASGEGLGFIGSILSDEEAGSVLCMLAGIAIVCMFAWWFAKAAGRYFLQQYFPGLYRKRYGGSAQPRQKRRRWQDKMDDGIKAGVFGLIMPKQRTEADIKSEKRAAASKSKGFYDAKLENPNLSEKDKRYFKGKSNYYGDEIKRNS
ncbi:MAG: hypothetical protein LUF27_11980 [Lachnospiraceae bacterium]|nr:hypothetical protein [Lachnospiraceae bacterium]